MRFSGTASRPYLDLYLSVRPHRHHKYLLASPLALFQVGCWCISGGLFTIQTAIFSLTTFAVLARGPYLSDDCAAGRGWAVAGEMNTNNKNSRRRGGGTGKRSRSRSNNNGGSGSTSTSTATATTTMVTAMERKEIERNRRLHMKSLCSKLVSLIPKEQHYPSSKDATMTQLGSLDEAAAYIRKLKARVEELQCKRSSAQLLLTKNRGEHSDGAVVRTTSSGTATATGSSSSEEATAEEPAAVVEVRQSHDGSSIEVVLISSVRRPFKLHEVVTVLEEEGAEVVNANISVHGQRMFHTIHSRAFSSRIGIDVSRVSQRLRALV